ncbi:HNH endonuclease [Peribacillus frigoritolerans]|uniref:HNH endonuclease n=1 Tax=Peribacillus frigoritolerans TaxID=450367 RepID=UPI00381066EC
MKTLTLAGIEFIKVGTGKKKIKLYDAEGNNLLVFRPFDGLTWEDFLNQLMDKPWEYIAGLLNECDGSVVEISAIEGTTSDFRIFGDIEHVKELAHKPFHEVIRTLDEIAENAEGRKGWKYKMIIENEIIAIHTNEAGEVAERTMDKYDAGKIEADENGYVVAHINGDIQDNRAENLQWVKVC